MATSALATAFVNIVPGTVELERYLKGELGTQAQAAGVLAGKSLTTGLTAGMKNAGAQMSKIGQGMSLAITAPLTAIGLKSIQTAADFGVTMATMQVNAEATGSQMESLRGLAIKMGQDTVFSAGEAAQAMLELSKGGMSIANIQGGALAASMNLAATEGIGLAESAGIVIQAMNQFKIPADQASTAVDLLAAGAVASTASIYDLAGGLKYVGTTANSLGVSLPETVTALAALNNAGIDATTAGTSLNMFMLRLIPTTRKAAEEAAALGLNFVDASGSLKPMAQVVRELQAEYSGMGDAAKAASLKTIFGVEGMRAANVLIEQGAAGWDALAKSVDKQGIASDLANARMSGLAGSIEMMKGSIDTALLSIGDRMTPAVMTLTQNITGLVNWFASLDPAIQGNIVNFLSFMAVAGPVILVLGKLFMGVSSIITGFTSLAGVAVSAAGGLANFATGLTNAAAGSSAFATPMMKLGGFLREAAIGFGQLIIQMGQYVAAQAVVFGTWVRDTAAKVANTAATIAQDVATKAAAAGQWLLNAAMSANPIGLLIVAIGALVAALVWFFTQTKTGQALWSGFVSFLQTTMTSVGNFFSSTAKNVVSAWNTTAAWFQALPSKLLGYFVGANQWLHDVGRNIIDGLWNGLRSAWDGVMSWASNIANSLSTTFKKVLGIKSPSRVFMEHGKNIGRGLIKGLEAMENPLTKAITAMGDNLSANVSVNQSVNGSATPILTSPVLATVSPTTSSTGNTVNYYAAPNQSLDAEQALFQAIKRAKVVGSW
jgi:TP901 family phage tail tape measure protein